NFLSVSFGKGTAKYSEVLGEDENLATIDQTMTGNYSIARINLLIQTEVAGAMLDQLIEFLKCSFVQQKVDAFARGHLAGRVLFLGASFTATGLGLLLTITELIELGRFCRLLFL